MKKTNPIYQVTAGNPKKLKKPVIWTVVTNINLFSFVSTHLRASIIILT